MTPGPSMTPPPIGFQPASSSGSSNEAVSDAPRVNGLSPSRQIVLDQLRAAAALYASSQGRTANAQAQPEAGPSSAVATSARQDQLSSDRTVPANAFQLSEADPSGPSRHRNAIASTDTTHASKYCTVCDTPLSPSNDFGPAPALTRIEASRDAPVTTNSVTPGQLLCNNCRLLLAREPASYSVLSHPQMNALLHESMDDLRPEQQAEEDLHSHNPLRDLPQPRAVSDLPRSSTSLVRAEPPMEASQDSKDAPMALDARPPVSSAQDTPLEFGPHLMTRPRLSTWTLQPLDPVSAQQADEIPVKRSDHRSARPAASLGDALKRPYLNERLGPDDKLTQQKYSTFFDHGRPDPIQDVTYIRRLPTSRGCLHAGARFEGKQTSDKSSYDVTVIFTHVDLEASHLCGTINIRGLTEDWPELITFFDAEIIGTKHGFVTGKWGATETQDAKHWGRFAPFKPLRKFLDKPGSRFDHLNKPYVFMRWKERFLVPDHRVKDVTGASYDGFYYVCLALDPEGADPVLPLPKPEITPPTNTRHLPRNMYPSAATGAHATRVTAPQLAEAIMNSPTGRIPSTYSPSWNPATSSLASAAIAQAQARRLEASVQTPSIVDVQAVGASYLGSGPTIASSSTSASAITSGAAAAPAVAAMDDIGIAALVHPNWAIENALLQSRRAAGAGPASLSATAAGLVPSQPQPQSQPQTIDGATGRRTFSRQTVPVPGGSDWVVMMEMEVEAETDSAGASPSASSVAAPGVGGRGREEPIDGVPGASGNAAANAVCDPPLTAPALATSTAPSAGTWLGAGSAGRTQGVPATRQSSRGLLDATLSQASRLRPATSLERSAPKVEGSGAGVRSREPVVGRCVGYYFSEHSEPFQQISLRYVPERPSGSFELR